MMEWMVGALFLMFKFLFCRNVRGAWVFFFFFEKLNVHYESKFRL